MESLDTVNKERAKEKKKGLKKVCKLGELKTTSSVHYTIKGLSVQKLHQKKNKKSDTKCRRSRRWQIICNYSKRNELWKKKSTRSKSEGGKKRRRLHVMSSAKGFFFSHARSPTVAALLSDSQVYSSRILPLSDAALLICSALGRNRNRR